MSELIVREYKNKFGLVNKWTYRGNTLIRTEFAYPRETINKKKTKIMSAKQELFDQIAEQFAILQENNEGTTKTSQARARKAAGELKKLVTPYKKANMDEVK
tara:strand:- start:319 stop:624 length:306 start_codon:yes stop_codon:yes gene_type:complete